MPGRCSRDPPTCAHTDAPHRHPPRAREARHPAGASGHRARHAPRSGRHGRSRAHGSTAGPRGRWRPTIARRAGVPVILRAWALLIRLLRVVRLAMAEQEAPFECWNERCPASTYKGYALTGDDVVIASGHLHCKQCGSYVRIRPNDDGSSKTIASTSGGAAVGFAVGGPAGALIGLAIGAAVAALLLSNKPKKKPRPQQRAAG